MKQAQVFALLLAVLLTAACGPAKPSDPPPVTAAPSQSPAPANPGKPAPETPASGSEPQPVSDPPKPADPMPVPAPTPTTAPTPALTPAPAPANPDAIGTTAGVRWTIAKPGLPVSSDDAAAEGKKVVLLTLDDGPDLNTTPRVLDILNQYDCRALFFVTGYGIGHAPWSKPEEVAAREALIKRMMAEGHQVGTHTVSHKNLRQMTAAQQREAILPVNRALEKLTGKKPKYFRPPFGAYNDDTLAILAEEGMENVLWSHGSLDWASTDMDPAEVVRNVLAEKPPTAQHTALHAGAVILMHDVHDHTARALPDILRGLKQKGYQCALLPED